MRRAFDCRGCEIGGFENTSKEFVEENEKVGSIFQGSGSFGFYTRFLLVKSPGPDATVSAEVPESPPAVATGRKLFLAADIGTHAVILGYLGAPVGQVVTLTATLDPARQPAKPKIPENESPEERVRRLLLHDDIPKTFQVLKVDGVSLPSPVEIRVLKLAWDPERKFPVGEPFEVRGCEKGDAAVLSEEFLKEYTDAGGQETLKTGPPQFVTWFTLLNPRK